MPSSLHFLHLIHSRAVAVSNVLQRIVHIFAESQAFVRTFSSRASLFAIDLWSSGRLTLVLFLEKSDSRLLTGIVCLMAVLLSLMESVILFLLLDLGPGNILLVSILVDLRVPDVRAHCDNG
jgi:hypothetical protein